MSAADLLEDGFPHGTVDGYRNGCRGSACPGELDFGLSCRRAKQLDAGDIRYGRLVRQGLTPAQIAAELGETPHEHPPAGTPPACRPGRRRRPGRGPGRTDRGRGPDHDHHQHADAGDHREEPEARTAARAGVAGGE